MSDAFLEVSIRYAQRKRAVKPSNLKYFQNKKKPKDVNDLATNGKWQKAIVSLIIKLHYLCTVNVNIKHI